MALKIDKEACVGCGTCALPARLALLKKLTANTKSVKIA
ncbi:MAG: 4Fe-4S binding protein [Phascolarctobacterium sp.]